MKPVSLGPPTPVAWLIVDLTRVMFDHKRGQADAIEPASYGQFDIEVEFATLCVR